MTEHRRSGRRILRGCSRRWSRRRASTGDRFARPAPRFMRFPKSGKGLQRVCVHAEARFVDPVAGPVLLGAGRYVGVGACAPRRGGWG
jgi:hypothetical protein